MTRGRKKDMTIQPSRSLAVQRAYRDRKAKYVEDLEERCQKAEAENERLRVELARALASSHSLSYRHEMGQQCTDLMQNLARTQESLARFQELTAKQGMPSTAELDIAAVLTHVLRQPPSADIHTAGEASREPTSGEPSAIYPAVLEADEEDKDCCGGFLDCTNLLDTEQPIEQQPDHVEVISRTLGHRSTLINS
ncbi:hypothetical protein FA95DRAFT_1533799 [Auriscalpium vulgare]|uniref:Uncharacterized protein n=1 Tax=Auriscalpium vulgare TaxID=40419 RepID=A0ACB8S5M9_9AGAM|nr:hypothetical protein FA95DRAFT_1533799 [Auriscalpium vulgare]